MRQAALMSLEKAFEPASPEAALWGLTSQHADVRRLALIRLYHRRLLGSPKVQSALRWRLEDGDAEVRRTAFLLTLASHEKLLSVLRSLDVELHRQLAELEATAPDGTGVPRSESRRRAGSNAPAGRDP